MLNSIRITDVSASTSLVDPGCLQAQRPPDPYLLVKSHRVAVGSRQDFQRRTATPSFSGPYVVTFGGVEDAAQLMVELWDRDVEGADDNLLEQVMIDFQQEPPSGTKTWPMSAGGSVTLTWAISPEPLFTPSSEPDMLRITRVAAKDLSLLIEEDAALEPYILMTGVALEVQQRWQAPAGADVSNPVWEEPKELLLDSQGYTVEVWTATNGQGDRLLGDALFLPERGAALEATLELSGLRGSAQVQIAYSTEVTGPGASPPVVVRKEVRSMSPAEQLRFVAAVQRLMVNKDGPQTSEWFRLAGYHGWPSDYCEHGQETFPGWHRAYLCELEQALMKADKELGNDGRIGVPYWDWTREINGEVLPKIIRDSFGQLPDGLVNPAEAGQLGVQGFSNISSEERLRQMLTSMQVARGAERCLTESEHWLHASTRGRGFSVESPHNSVHVACGFPMSTVPYAAFHPIFFLHHSNCDRIYEKHVQMETPEECASEFAMRQQALAQNGETNRFLQPLAPFMHPYASNRQMMPSDTFDTKALGYEYDELPPEPQQGRLLMEEPVYAAFENIQVLELERKSYALHVFLAAKGSEWAPSGRPKDWPGSPGYAGAGAIFGGRAQECHNCRSRPPFCVLVEVQQTLQEMHLSRHDVEVHVMCEDELGVVLPLEETPVPQPVLMGPWFENDMPLRCGDSGAEVLQLQKALIPMGYLADDPSCANGVFDATTEEAVKEFQKFCGLVQDGIAGPVTKAQITAQRFDRVPDVVPRGKRFKDGLLTYGVGLLPGYLERHRDACIQEIHEAMAQWSSALGLVLRRTSHLQARIHVVFEPLALEGEAPAPGGALAEATANRVVLDSSERWLLKAQTKPDRFPKAFYLTPVLLHEVGHSLGLKHSADPADVMWPYYRAEPNLRLTAADRSALAALARNDEACVCTVS